MKFKIEKQILGPILPIMSKLPLSRKSDLMEDNCLFVEVVDGKLILKVYDGYEIYIESTIDIDADFYEPGVARFDRKLFNHIVNGLDGELLIEDTGKMCTIRCGRTRIETYSSVLNELLNRLDIAKVNSDYNEFVIKGDVLKASLEAVSVAVGKDINNPELMNILLTFDENVITFISTDGYRLVKIEEKCKSSECIKYKEVVVLPAGVMPLIIGLLKTKRDVYIRVNREAVCFDLGKVKLHVKRADHNKYPKVDEVLKRESGKIVDVDRKSIMRAIEQIKIVGEDTIVLDNKTSLDESKMTVRNRTGLGDKKSIGCEVVVDIEKEEKLDFNISFRASVLHDGLKIMRSDEISMKIKSDKDFVVIRSKDESSKLYLLMPYML